MVGTAATPHTRDVAHRRKLYLGRLTEKNLYDKLDRELLSSGMDNGDAWTLQNVLGDEMITWNSRRICFEIDDDALHRNIRKWTRRGLETSRKLVLKTIYSEHYRREGHERKAYADPTLLNLRGELWQIFDQAGRHTSERFDIRGRPVA